MLYQSYHGIVNTGCCGYTRLRMGTEKPFLHFNVEPELLKKLDDFRFKQRFDSRAAAIKWLLDAALKAKLAPKDGE